MSRVTYEQTNFPLFTGIACDLEVHLESFEEARKTILVQWMPSSWYEDDSQDEDATKRIDNMEWWKDWSFGNCGMALPGRFRGSDLFPSVHNLPVRVYIQD